jgi:predicted glycogen debranching enzyme
MIRLNRDECSNIPLSKSREWLVTNGLGGYASGTVAGMNTRRYHGLLVAPTALGNLVLLSQLEDALIIDGVRFPLSTNLYAGNVLHPAGYLNLAEFRLDPFPVFVFAADDWELTRAISMIPGENTIVVDYQLSGIGAERNALLEVRPLMAFRGYHSTTHENGALNRQVQQGTGELSVQPYPSLPKLHLAFAPAEVQTDGYWYRRFEYDQERERGLDFNEDLFSPFALSANLRDRSRFRLVASTEPLLSSRLDEYARVPDAGKSKSVSPVSAESSRSDLIPRLEEAAAQFIITRGSFTSIIAGYHWFGDWGRDTMIALPGLLLATGRHQLAKEILLHYVQYVDEGMLPNRFPDAGDKPEYNTVDATLWFFEAIRMYVGYEDSDTWRSAAAQLLRDHFYTPLQEIVRRHVGGTRYNIHVDDDGFLWAGDPHSQLTWMDAKDGDVAFTPRRGRAVEIQALWYNALCTLSSFCLLLGEESRADEYIELAARLRDNFLKVFWNEDRQCLFDVVRIDERDSSLRPNQIFAVSLRYPLISGQTATRVVQTVEAALLTPFGLRTLSQDDPKYRGTCTGDPYSRDSAYHQGTVWPWLAGPFFSAKLAVSDSPKTTTNEIEKWLDGFSTQLRESGLGQISEIFDGESPHAPRGAIAQAWSVAEILRLAKLVDHLGSSERTPLQSKSSCASAALLQK